MSLLVRRSRAAKLAAGLFLGAFALAAGFPVHAQQDAGSAWISLGRYTATDMTAADAARVRAERSAIAQEAAFFAYDLSLPGWKYSQAVCPDIPGHLILHYRRAAHNGAESLFTAMVPRDSGRVQVVPVLYRGATPFHSAVGSERSLSVFNRAVPGSLAEKELQPSGAWLQLALCYAELAGAEPRVPRAADTDPALVRAPAPTLLISEVNHTASVTFTDRIAPHRYTVWTVAFDGRGRVVAATATSLGDYIGRNVHGKAPEERPLPAQSQPKIIPLPPASEPKVQSPPQ